MVFFPWSYPLCFLPCGKTHTMSFEVITRLRYDKELGTYSIFYGDHEYEFPASLLDNFKKYILQNGLVSMWYENNKDQVSRTSIYD